MQVPTQNITQEDIDFEKESPLPVDQERAGLLIKTRIFLSPYKWLLIPLILIITITFIISHILHIQKAPSTTPANQQINTQVTASSKQITVSPEISQSSQSNLPRTFADEVNDIALGKLKYMPAQQESISGSPGSEFAGASINQETLSDGSKKYEYSSSDPKRPDMQIVKDGVVIFRRSVVINTLLSTYAEFITNPPYAAEGSSYYGPDAVILANPSRGVALVYNPQSNQVYEQYLFKAMSVTDFSSKFREDISTYNPVP